MTVSSSRPLVIATSGRCGTQSTASERGVAVILSGDDYLLRFGLLNAMRNQAGEVVLADLMLPHANSAPWDYVPMGGEGLSFPGGLDTTIGAAG